MSFEVTIKHHRKPKPGMKIPEVKPLVIDCEGTTVKIPRQETYKLNTNLFRLKPPKVNLYKCSEGFLVGSTTPGQMDGRFYLKMLFCRKEWCPCCGSDYSIPHERRILALFNKVISTKKLGYLVVTVPKELREFFKDIKVLRDFKTYFKRKLKRTEKIQNGWKTVPGKEFKKSCRVSFKPNYITREGYKYGFIRYHYAGEDGTEYKPHLNILIPEGYLKTAILDQWKKDLVSWFITYFNIDPEIFTPVGNIYYQYCQPEQTGKKIHWLKYITRSTLVTPDPVTKGEAQLFLYNFKNSTKWGPKHWPTTEHEASEAGEIINKNICPQTGLPIIWQWFAKYKEAVKTDNYKDLGLGVTQVESGYLMPGRYCDIKERKLKGKLSQESNFSILKEPKPPPGIKWNTGYSLQCFRN